MDFRTCPACNASVLEDDAQDCPFCGASMSGKGGGTAKAKPKPAAAAAKAAPAPAATPEKKPAPKPPAGGRKPDSRKLVGETTADEENPFEVDTAAVRRAVPVSPKPTKSRTHRVVCEMCETAGFISPSDAGKDVKCCNPNCMVPIFRAPAIEKEVVVEEEPKGWFTAAKLAVLVVAVLGIGVGAFFWLNQQDDKKVVDNPLQPNVQPSGLDKKHLVQQKPEKVEKPLTPAEIRQQSLIRVDKEASSRNRSRTAGYQLATETHADGGDLKGAGELLARLRREAQSADFLLIQPLVRMALQHLAAGNRDEAGKLADSAMKLADRLPNVDRQSLDSAVTLAALLVQLGRIDDAKGLVSKHNDTGPRGFASLLWTSATEGKSFNINAEVLRPYHVAVANPLWVSLVEVLVDRGEGDAALALCADAPDEDSRDACRAAWAGAMAGTPRGPSADPEDLITKALGSDAFSPAAKARAWAAVASRQKSGGDPAAAAQSLTQAQTALEAVPAVKPLLMPGMKAIYDSRGKHHAGLPDPAPVRSVVLAYASIGLVQAQLDDPDSAWKSVVAALNAARGMAPSMAQVQEKVDEAAKQKQLVEDELVRLLKINAGDGPARFRAFNDYRGQVHKLQDEGARPRFNLEVDILRAAVDAGLVQQVWDYMEQVRGEADVAIRQPYLDSDLPGYVKTTAQLAGESALAAKVDAAFAGKKVSVNIVDQVMFDAGNLIAREQLGKAGDWIGQMYWPGRAKDYSDRFDVAVLRLTGKLQETLEADKVMNEFILELRNPLIKEDALRLLAARSMQTGQAPKLWPAIGKHLKLEPTERAALYRGFVEVNPPAKPAAGETAASSASSPPKKL